MPHQPTPPPTRTPRLRPAIALRKCLREGYGWAELRRDVLAGMVVGVVALPLSMALAIAVGVAPQHGLYTAIVAGAVIAVLGGSRVQISGPTAAFVVILAPIVGKFGLGGLLLATMMAGLFLILFAVVGLGRLIEFVPYPVTTGFTAGIGVVIATLQLKDFLGLQMGAMPESYADKVMALGRALPTARWPEVAIGVLTLALLLLWPRFQRSIPAPLVALTVAAVAAWLLERWVPGLEIATIERRFSYTLGGASYPGIPPLPPLPGWPWGFAGADGRPIGISLELLRALVPSAFVIAVLGAIESLLSAVVADGMIRRQHDPDGELLAQGIGNLVVPFFGGIAATGAIARTATNVRHGGRSPVAGVVHAVFLLLATLVLAPWLGKLPMAALAALLLVVAWNMAEARLVVRTVVTAPRSDALVLLTCLGLTVIFDMVVAVVVGVMLAAFLFMRRMVEVSQVRLVSEPHRRLLHQLPPGVVLYEIAGPLFFGAASRAMRALQTVDQDVKAVILDLRSVPALDATGLVSLEATVERLAQAGILVVLGGLDRQPLRALVKAGWHRREQTVILRRSFDQAVLEAKTRFGAAEPEAEPEAEA